jgi:signal transduction histidine kinase
VQNNGQRAVALAIAPMVAVTVWLALSSDHVQRPAAAALYWGYLVAAPMAIGLYWRLRRPARRLGPLLVAYGMVAWVVSWASSDRPLGFDVAALAQPLFFALTLYLLLAFPTGRLEGLAPRRLFAAQIVAFLVAYPVLFLFSPIIVAGGATVGCAPGCPENLLQVGSASTLVEVAGKAGLAMTVAIAAGVVVVFVGRLRTATRPRRRALMAVAITSLLFLPVTAAFHLAFLLELDPELVDTLAWATAFAQLLVPLGFLIALVQAEVFAAGVLRTLLERLTARPTPDEWRDAVAGALDDDSLRLAYYDPASQRFCESDGRELARPSRSSGRAWVPVDPGAREVAAMVVDETLTEDPELVRVAASATLLAVESGALEGELRASRARIVEAGDAERRRIERDLHDGAQQRLVALRLHLALVAEKLGRSSAFDSLGVEVDEAIHELRDLAQGLYPPLLGQAGVGTALAAVARRSGMPVRIDENGLSRQSIPVETTVYFCCVECLQNIAKHAGPGVSVTIGLAEEDGGLEFSVADDGAGFDPASVQRGSGLTNLADRLEAVGGTLRIDSRPGDGTRVTGRVPTA